MARSEQGKSTRLNRDWTKKRSGIAAPISLEDLMEKEVQLSTQDCVIREVSVLLTQQTNSPPRSSGRSTSWITPKKLIEVLRSRLVI